MRARRQADQALAVPATPASAVDGPTGFDPSRMKSAFMAGWLAAVNRRDVAPEEAWLTYLDCLERENAKHI